MTEETVYCAQCQQHKAKKEFVGKAKGKIYAACRDCRRAYSREWMRNRRTVTHATVRYVLAAALGACCARCGYDTFDSALEFYSSPLLDPHPEIHLANTINRFVYNAKEEVWEDVLQRADVHILLCANCHKALRAGDWDVNELEVRTGLQYRPPMPETTVIDQRA